MRLASIRDYLRSILGTAAEIGENEAGVVQVSPCTEEECALILSTAAAEGWRVRLQGTGNWIRADAHADLAISTRLLAGVTEVCPDDLLATARGGTPWRDLQSSAGREGMWMPLDPPGQGRSLGSVVATGTDGPLRCGFGPVKRQVLGLTLICGDGRIVRVGGRVVKNVAGYDVRKLAVGGFGAFGLISSVHIRLCALPQVDVTLSLRGARDELLETALAILGSGTTPAALELLSPKASHTDAWLLAIRLVGSSAWVEAEADAISGVVSTIVETLPSEKGRELWRSVSAKVTTAPMSIRVGCLPSAMAATFDLMRFHLDEDSQDWTTACVRAGAIRWSGNASVKNLTELREAAASQKKPVTLERAPAKVLNAVGHFGSYSDGVAVLVGSLRTAFDNHRTLAVPLDSGQ